MKKTIAIFVPAVFAAASLIASSLRVEPGDPRVPAVIRDAAASTFPKKASAFVKIDSDDGRISYEVKFADGSEAEFSPDGKWTEIDCLASPVPAALIPKEVAEYVAANFPGRTVTKISREKRGGYDLTLSDKSEVDLDAKMQWIEIDCGSSPVPAALVPQKIAEYASANYPGKAIVEISREKRGGYEVKLAGGLELKFSADGAFLGID